MNSTALLVSFGTLLVNFHYLLVSFGTLLVNFRYLLVSFEIKKSSDCIKPEDW
ncbi:MAG: hypothetical protein ACQEXK_09195 [Bacillota bacterium]